MEMRNKFRRWCHKTGLSHPHLPVFLGLMTVVVALSYGNMLVWLLQQPISKTEVTTKIASTPNRPQVLGSYYSGENAVYIAAKDNKYGYNGGVVSLTSVDDPVIAIGARGVSGDVQVQLYRADTDRLLSYLKVNDEGDQVQPIVDSVGLTLVAEKTYQLVNEETTEVTLPLEQSGIYLLKMRQGDIAEADAFVIRSKTGVIAKEGDNQIVYWGVDHGTKRSISEGRVRVFGLTNEVKELGTADFNGQGIATSQIGEDVDIALATRGEDTALIPLNMHYLNANWDYSSFVQKDRVIRYFMFTDRPLYRPGDSVQFKAVMRDDDDVRYSVGTNPVTVTAYSGYGKQKQEIYRETLTQSDYGTVDGTIVIPKDAKPDYYTLNMDAGDVQQSEEGYLYGGGSTGFQVQHFKKPDYYLDVTADRLEYIAGDEIQYTIKGEYFSGQGMGNEKVSYALFSDDFYEYEYKVGAGKDLNQDVAYGEWYGTEIKKGSVNLNANGEATLTIPAKSIKNKSQVYGLLVKLTDKTGVTDEAVTNALVYSGEFGMYRSDNSWGYGINSPVTVEMIIQSRVDKPVAGIDVNAAMKRTWWEKQPIREGQKFAEYKELSEDLPALAATTSKDGNFSLKFTPTKGGSYNLVLQAKDTRANIVETETSVYVRDDPGVYATPVYQEPGIQVSVNQKVAQPDGSVRVVIESATPDRDVFLGIERARLNRYQVVSLQGNRTEIDLPMVMTDMPNVYVSASGFSTDWLDTAQVNLPVATDIKQLVVNLKPEATRFGPGESVTIDIESKDGKGTPRQAEMAVWVVDKALFELVGKSNLDIFDAFWQERYNDTQTTHSLEGITAMMAEGGGGCFVGDTQVLMSDGMMQPISKVQIGDEVQTRASETDPTLKKAKVLGIHQQTTDGYYTINGTLKVTANHRMFVNGIFTEASTIQLGDTLIDQNNQPVVVESMYWTRQLQSVYNLEIEKYHTYFAGNVWVHNQKGEVRETFKDTAYWNPRVVTDQNGKGQVTFALPDNLTTWVVAAVGTTIDTTVGDAQAELQVSKDIVVRPAVPNLLRLGDSAKITALVHNFSETDYTFTTSMTFDAGRIEGPTSHTNNIPAGDKTQVAFTIVPEKITEGAKLAFSTKAQENSKVADAITVVLPIEEYGFYDHGGGGVALGTHTYPLTVASSIDPQKSSITLGLATDMLGTLPESMRYLLTFPYGCTEQTTSRLVPAIMAKAYPQYFSILAKDANTTKIISDSIERLKTLQNSDGGWGFWNEGQSYPFSSAYAVEYISRANELKLIDQESATALLSKARIYLSQLDTTTDTQNGDWSNEIYRRYASTFLPIDSGYQPETTLINATDDLTDDVLAVVVMTNVKNGHTNNNQNGATLLASKGVAQGEARVWQAGPEKRLGSDEASTALAIRALVAAGMKEEAYKGVLYLSRNKQSAYWGNTYASSQVMDALLTYGEVSKNQSPNYSYQVRLGGKELAAGTVTAAQQSIPAVTVPVEDVQAGGDKLAVTMTGEGELYSTLTQKIFVIDQEAEAVNQGMGIERVYLSEKGVGYTPAVGDTINVLLKITNPNPQSESYTVIEDTLPAGMMPINPGFKNEKASTPLWNQPGVVGSEITQNGIVLSISGLPSGTTTYKYQARVVTAGSFLTAPATVMMMYMPELYGRSNAEKVAISDEAVFDAALAERQQGFDYGEVTVPTQDNLLNQYWWLIGVVSLVVLTIGIGGGIWWRRRKRNTPSDEAESTGQPPPIVPIPEPMAVSVIQQPTQSPTPEAESQQPRIDVPDENVPA